MVRGAIPAGRRRGGIALVVVTALLIAGAAVSWYAHAALVDGREFSSRTTDALNDSDFRTVLAERVVGGLTRSAVPDALVVRPLLVPVVATLADTSAFRRLLARAVRDRHRAVIEGETTFRFELPVGDGVLFESLRRVSPRVARAIPPDLTVPVVRLDPHDAELAAAGAVLDLAGWRWPLTLAALLAAAGSALLAGGARAALVHLGVAAAGGGLIVAAAVAGLGEFVVSHAAHAADLSDEAERGAVRALWTALFSDLVTSALVVALGGGVVAALASTEVPAARLGAAVGWARALVTSPTRPARLARAAGLIAGGSLLIFDPALLARITLVTAGALAVLAGVSQLSGGGPRREPARRPGGARVLPLAGAMVLAIAATALVVALVLPAPNLAPAESAGPAEGCNGSRALCRRRLDQVAFAGTHNSYAAADEPGWLFANQRHGIERQLRDGIRALTLDIHYGASDPSNGRVRTDLAGEDSSRNKVAQQLSPGALRVADSLVGRAGVGRATGERRPYLCHTLCELGAEPLDEELRVVGRFMADNPGEVVVAFIEPYVPVATVERALRRVGLLTHAARIRLNEPLPTLGRLVRADTRLVVLAEEDGGTRPWYLPGFSFVQDTPLGAKTPEQLRCGRYRGRPNSPMLLVNHWIPPFPPSVTRNERIGDGFLTRRLRRCERRRGLLPNLIAVDFYEGSGVVEAARRLNARR